MNSRRVPHLLASYLLILACCVPCALHAQAGGSEPSASASYVPTMTFDVVSVKENKPDLTAGFMVGGNFTGNSGTWNLTNNNVGNLLGWAYGVSSHQLEGVPAWADHSYYNVEAKCDPATDAKLAALTPKEREMERQHMIQALLADHFNLKAHWETREASVFYLTAIRSGSKMHPGGSMPPSSEELKNFGGHPIPEIYQRGDGKRGYEYIGHGAHMAMLASDPQLALGTDVIDRTGLTGTYDFDLQYGPSNDAERAEDPDLWPPIPEAIEEQLGLKLERAKGSVRMLVVDHIDRLSEN
ncbi:TIGR03435 family protein [Silvibacterium sp.]|uniref:TIGR03435 family protein n=1 Tax=Silvibacterium sp. TaxID=1964179 RepID=UPI0039E49A3D